MPEFIKEHGKVLAAIAGIIMLIILTVTVGNIISDRVKNEVNDLDYKEYMTMPYETESESAGS